MPILITHSQKKYNASAKECQQFTISKFKWSLSLVELSNRLFWHYDCELVSFENSYGIYKDTLFIC